MKSSPIDAPAGTGSGTTVTALRKKFSISLSGRSVAAFEELKKMTDADTESEVFRNALRLHAALIRAHQDGKQIYLQDGNGKSIVPVDIFVGNHDVNKRQFALNNDNN